VVHFEGLLFSMFKRIPANNTGMDITDDDILQQIEMHELFHISTIFVKPAPTTPANIPFCAPYNAAFLLSLWY
jgi:hypothetical protein